MNADELLKENTPSARSLEGDYFNQNWEEHSRHRWKHIYQNRNKHWKGQVIKEDVVKNGGKKVWNKS